MGRLVQKLLVLVMALLKSLLGTVLIPVTLDLLELLSFSIFVGKYLLGRGKVDYQIIFTEMMKNLRKL